MLEIDKPQTAGVQSAIERLRSRMSVGRMIVQHRLRLGVSQAEIARRAGTKQSRVSEIETLSGNVRFDTLDRIAMALGLQITLVERPDVFAVAGAGAQPQQHASSAMVVMMMMDNAVPDQSVTLSGAYGPVYQIARFASS